jgi:hypothetical protein
MWGSQVVTILLLNIRVFCDVPLCRWVSSYRRFEGPVLHLQSMAAHEETVQLTTLRSSESWGELQAQRQCDVPKQITSAEPLPKISIVSV